MIQCRSIRGIFSVIVIACLMLSGCANKEPKETAFVLVVFDLSVGAQAVRDRYLAGFEKIVAALEAGDSVVGDVITETTEKTASFPIDATLPAFNLLEDDELGYKARVSKMRKHLQGVAEDLLRRKASNSDIMSAFVLAGRAFGCEKAKVAQRRVFVLFTDGIEQTPELDFTATKDLTDLEIERIIATQRDMGRLPDLSGVSVYMVGVNAMIDPSADMGHGSMAWVERFWLAYAAATNAELDKANYSPSLINFSVR